jgi:hypothetical protein
MLLPNDDQGTDRRASLQGMLARYPSPLHGRCIRGLYGTSALRNIAAWSALT